MAGFRSTIARYQLWVFLLLAFTVSWIELWLWLAGTVEKPGLNPLGPFVATVVVVALVGGWSGLRETFGRMAHVRGVGGWTWALAVLIPVATGLITAALSPITGAPAASPQALSVSGLATAFVFMILIVAPGEEPGWRGYLQTWLNGRLAPMIGTLVMAAIWMAWHTPMFMADSTSKTLPPHLLGQLAGCFILVWLTNRAAGSVLPAMLSHASSNVVNGALPYRAETFWLFSGVSTVVALTLILATRGRLGYVESVGRR